LGARKLKGTGKAVILRRQFNGGSTWRPRRDLSGTGKKRLGGREEKVPRRKKKGVRRRS